MPEFPRIELLGSPVNKSGPEHVLYVVQDGPNSYTQRSYGLTLSTRTGAPRSLEGNLVRPEGKR